MNRSDLTITGVVIDEAWEVTLGELCQACQTSDQWIIEMVEYGLLNPSGTAPENWSFKGNDLGRLQKTLRLHEDLQINFSGIALILDLLEEVDALRKKAECLEKIISE